jgi:osmotically-inducible protein OsmY
MMKTRLWLFTCALALAVGCGDYSGKQTSTSRNQSRDFGSATDVSKNGELPIDKANPADNGLGGPVQREVGNYQSQPLRAEAADAELAKKIKVALTTGSTGTTGSIAENQLTKIDVQVHDGNVTLSGPVANEAEKKSIGKQVAGFKDVKSVRNNLTVGGRGIESKPLQPLVPRASGNE